MPDRREHLAQATRNEAFARSAIAGEYPEWAVIALFYAAVHLVDAYLVGLPLHPRTHEQRRIAVHRTALRTMFSHYVELQNRSEDARYDCRRFASGDVAALDANHFQPLRLRVRRLLRLR